MTSAKREAARRSRGRPVSTVLTNLEAIAAYDALIAVLGGPKPAIEYALTTCQALAITEKGKPSHGKV